MLLRCYTWTARLSYGRVASDRSGACSNYSSLIRISVLRTCGVAITVLVPLQRIRVERLRPCQSLSPNIEEKSTMKQNRQVDENDVVVRR